MAHIMHTYHHWQTELHRKYPVNLNVISWLGVWYVKRELYEQVEYTTIYSVLIVMFNVYAAYDVRCMYRRSSISSVPPVCSPARPSGA